MMLTGRIQLLMCLWHPCPTVQNLHCRRRPYFPINSHAASHEDWVCDPPPVVDDAVVAAVDDAAVVAAVDDDVAVVAVVVVAVVAVAVVVVAAAAAVLFGCSLTNTTTVAVPLERLASPWLARRRLR